MVESSFKIGAFAIIADDQQRVLLCHRRDMDAWNLPGGGTNGHETPWEAVVREVEEETGLRVQTDRLLGIYVKRDKDTVVFSFECSVVGGTPHQTDEADRVEYFSAQALPDGLLEKQRQRIADWASGGHAPVMKAQ